MTRWVDKEVLGFDVAMTDAECVDVGKCSEHLVGVEFDEEDWNTLLHFDVVLHNAVHSLRNVVHDDVQVHFIRLRPLALSHKPCRQ